MKMTAEHFDHLQTRINAADTPELRAMYRERNPAIRNIDKAKDLDMRYRWDLFNHAVPVKWTCDELYTYLDDTHIDTALRRIVPTL